MAEPQREVLRLNRNESAVLGELVRLELGVPEQRLTRTYRRILELSRSNEPIDGILVAHLVREFLAAFAFSAMGNDLPRGRLEYRERVGAIAMTWPADVRGGVPPDATIAEVRHLLNDHDASSERAGNLAGATFQRGDRVSAGYVPDHSTKRWLDLSRRSSGFAHRIKNLGLEIPTVEEGRRIVDELTATLLAAVGPFLTGVDEIDRFLSLEAPDRDAANRVAALLRTPAQESYFLDRAGEQWLEPLAAIGAILTSTPPLIDVGEGYVAPGWPQGRFLARVATSDPDLVLGLLGRIQHRDNPQVVTGIVRVARALPADHARRLTDQVARWVRVPLVLEYAAVETAALARDLAIAGFAREGATLLMAVVKAAAVNARDSDWHLEQALGDPVEAIVGAGGDLAHPLRTVLKDLLRRQGPIRRYSASWLRRVDQRPRYGPRREWYVANSVYRVLLTADVESAQALAAELIRDREHVLVRIALAAIAERPELAGAADTILSDPVKWDDAGTTRYEFRRALRSLWLEASDGGRESLLAYAVAAKEAMEIAERLVRGDFADPPTPEQVRQGWRSRLLYAILDLIPAEWSDRLGPLEALEDEGVPEVTAHRVGHVSPASEDELAKMEPSDVMSLLRDWVPGPTRSFDEPTLEGLATAASAVISSRAAQFRHLGGELCELEPRVVSAVMSSLLRGLGEDRIDDKGAAVGLALDIGQAFLARPDTDAKADADSWSRQVARDLAGTIAKAANGELLAEVDGATVVGLLRILLDDDDPTPESELRDAGGGYDVAMLALNSVRGEATTAGIELLLEAARLDWKSLAAEFALLLRQAVAKDRSLSVRGAVGLRLPWLLARDQPHHGEWLEILFGHDVPRPVQRATWDAYLVYSRFFRDTVALLADQYEAALAELSPHPEGDRTRPRDPDESLGIHVALAYLLGLPVEAAGGWLRRFYGNAADWVRARVTRWIAEQAADADAEPEVRDRARTFLRERIALMSATGDEAELKAVGWIGRTADRPGDVLESIVLPALERSGGATDNEPGLADLVARCATEVPLSAARTLELLVRGDRWRSMPHVAAAELRRALEVMRVADPDTQEVAGRIVNLLSEQGFLDYRDLLPPAEA